MRWVKHVWDTGTNHLKGKVETLGAHKYGIRFPKSMEKTLKIDRQNGNHRQGDAIERKQELHRQSRKESHQRSKEWKGFEVDWIPGDCLSPRLWRENGSDLTGMLLQWE